MEEVNPPAASSMIVRRIGNPLFGNVGESTPVYNVENILTVTQGVAFTTTRVNMIPAAFPWLNGPASSFSKFRFEKIEIVYIPNCSTATAGTVVISPGYDTGDAVPTSVQQAQQAYRSVTTPPWGGSDGCSVMSKRGFGSIPSNAVTVVYDAGRTL